ncbi:MAG: RHS repeat-associated core domain-containing protein [Pirellulales bacterium]|nr:RHS repeat-associated core domain-containing protein [Pirellulales bacterium]
MAAESSSDPAHDTLFAFTGAVFDIETGLQHHRARYYDPRTGRFLGEDPALADTNLYRYAGNNPVNAIDPSGLATQRLGGGSAGNLAFQFALEGDSYAPRGNPNALNSLVNNLVGNDAYSSVHRWVSYQDFQNSRLNDFLNPPETKLQAELRTYRAQQEREVWLEKIRVDHANASFDYNTWRLTHSTSNFLNSVGDNVKQFSNNPLFGIADTVSSNYMRTVNPAFAVSSHFGMEQPTPSSIVASVGNSLKSAAHTTREAGVMYEELVRNGHSREEAFYGATGNAVGNQVGLGKIWNGAYSGSTYQMDANENFQFTKLSTSGRILQGVVGTVELVTTAMSIASPVKAALPGGGVTSPAGGARATGGLGNLGGGSLKVWSSATGDVVVDAAALPGRTGMQVGRRLTNTEMEGLQLAHGREFALIYETGAGRNGGGGRYLLFSGDHAKVWFPANGNYRWISHTHPAGYAQHASKDDMLWLQLMQKNGNPQRYSTVVPLDGDPFKFSSSINRVSP